MILSVVKVRLFRLIPHSIIRIAWFVCGFAFLSMPHTALAQTETAAPTALSYDVKKTLPHEPKLFTQGLFLHDGHLIESSGLYRQSLVRRYDIDTDKTVAEYVLDDNLFAEGLVKYGPHIYTLTWREQTLLVLKADSLTPVSRVSYRGQGWGLTHDGQHFIMSDGSAKLQLRNSRTFDLEKQIAVTRAGKPVADLNELEYAQGFVWANVWQQDIVVRIDMSNGMVTGVVDFSELAEQNQRRRSHNVLNGIAYDAERDEFWITGKNWKNLYIVKIAAPAPKSKITFSNMTD